MRLINTYLNFLKSYFFSNPINPAMITLKIIVIASLFLLCIYVTNRLLSYLRVNLQMQHLKYRSQMQAVRANKSVRYKFGPFAFIDNKLKKNGRPLGLTAVKYIAYKILITLIALAVSALFTGFKIPVMIIFGVAGFFIIDLLLIIDSRDNITRIEQDMPVIINNLYMQLEAKVPFVECVSTLHLSAESSKLLKEGLKEFSIRFAMNDYDIDAACNDLEKKFSNVTLSILLMAFRQYKDSGKMKDILKRQYELHLKREEEMLEASSNSLLKLAAVSTILIGINCVLMIVYPMYISMTENMYNVMG